MESDDTLGGASGYMGLYMADEEQKKILALIQDNKEREEYQRRIDRDEV